ncbi:hypothetical protein [Candidatus Williamhamiltonella defendens]|uniref:hypothetical protein n=1 Tax=Candidatus Williamhamiltonella defendens TaxID=138072 RepID=UPI00130EB40F|nr:hypothetical protein [Candidatus Hamiltonella defensa]
MNKYQNKLNNAKKFFDLQDVSIKLSKNKKLLKEFKKDMNKFKISDDTINKFENSFNSEIKNKIDELNLKESIKAIVKSKTDVISSLRSRLCIQSDAK